MMQHSCACMTGGEAHDIPTAISSERKVRLAGQGTRADRRLDRPGVAGDTRGDASMRRLRGRNAYDTPVRREEFPLITMADELARMRQEIATGRGFFVFRGLERDRYSDNELGLIFRGFGAHFGHELTQSAFGDRLGDIRDISDIGAAISQAASRPRTPTRVLVRHKPPIRRNSSVV